MGALGMSAPAPPPTITTPPPTAEEVAVSMREDVQSMVMSLALGSSLDSAAASAGSSGDSSSTSIQQEIEPPAYVAETSVGNTLSSGEAVESTIESSISVSGISSDAIVPEMVVGISNSIAQTLGVASDQVNILGILPGEVVISSSGSAATTTTPAAPPAQADLSGFANLDGAVSEQSAPAPAPESASTQLGGLPGEEAPAPAPAPETSSTQLGGLPGDEAPAPAPGPAPEPAPAPAPAEQNQISALPGLPRRSLREFSPNARLIASDIRKAAKKSKSLTDHVRSILSYVGLGWLFPSMQQVSHSHVRTALLKHALVNRGAAEIMPDKKKNPTRKLMVIPPARTGPLTKRSAHAHSKKRVLQVGLNSGESKMSINYVVLLKKEDVDSGKAVTLQQDMGKMTEDTSASSDGSSSGTGSSMSSGLNFMETLKKTVAEVVENLPPEVKAKVSAAVDTTQMKAEVVSVPQPRSVEEVNQQVAVLRLVKEIINSGQAE